MIKFSRNNFRTSHACFKFVFACNFLWKKKEREEKYGKRETWNKLEKNDLLFTLVYFFVRFPIFDSNFELLSRARLCSLRIANRWRIKILPQNFISRAYSRDFFGTRSCNFYLASLSRERERSVNIFYSNRRGVSFTNWKEIENHVSE